MPEKGFSELVCLLEGVTGYHGTRGLVCGMCTRKVVEPGTKSLESVRSVLLTILSMDVFEIPRTNFSYEKCRL